MQTTVPDPEARQAPVIKWVGERLSAAAGEAAKRIDTQGAVVWLAGREACKIRRAIRLPFLDYSTIDKRREATLAEIDVNHAAAPEIYREAVAISLSAGGYAFGTDGEIVEWATRMRRFDEDATLDKLAERGELTDGLIAGLAEAIHAAHQRAPIREAASALRSLATWIDQNRAAFADEPDLFAPAEVEALTARARAALEANRELLTQRGALGFVRRCHGDLHLRNIALIDGRPTPFDAIEFDDSIATGDVLYDLAFAAMDLWERGFRHHANALVNGYLAHGGQAHYSGLAALPLFLSVRAAIRAKVEAANRLHVSDSQRARVDAAARRYFEFALEFLAPAPAQLVAVGGLSGSGKSALARAIAPELGRAPGAVWISSDVERKRMFAAAETERLPDSAYDAATTREVYARLRREAELALAAGQSVVLDATHARAADRVASAKLARARIAFLGLWLEAPLATRLARVEARRFDPSDADARVVAAQRADPIAEPGWVAIDASGGFERTLDAARAVGAR